MRPDFGKLAWYSLVFVGWAVLMSLGIVFIATMFHFVTCGFNC